MKPRPIPEDFPENALQPARTLAMRYRVSNKTIALWRLELGIKLQPGARHGRPGADPRLPQLQAAPLPRPVRRGAVSPNQL